jgi:BNR/Asp-box repeat
MKKTILYPHLFLCIGLVIITQAYTLAQSSYTNILIADNKGGGFGPCEPSIFINPKNPQNIVAGSVLNEAHFSFDGGKTWNRTTLTSPYGVYGDPCIIADKHGHFYYFHLSDSEGKSRSGEGWLDRMVCQKSLNGGKTWDKGRFMGLNPPKDQDKEWAVADPKSGNIYVTWTQFDKYGSENTKDSTHILFAKSSNGGKSWSIAKRINQIGGNCIDDDKTTEGAVPAVGPLGEVYVSWSVNDKIYFDASHDAGKTWMAKDIEVADLVGGWSYDIPGLGRANGMPVTACDLSKSEHRGTIYINWSAQKDNDTDVWLAKSTDGGNTWSKPLKVNDDKSGKHQFFNWMAVDPSTGYIYIVFYDRRNYTDNQTDVYLATSKDGGVTFTNERISASPFIPSTQGFFGDYNNISAINGIVRPIWTRMDAGKLSIWTALIDKTP